VEIGRLVASDLDGLIAALAGARDTLTGVTEAAEGCAESLRHLRTFIDAWRVQVPRWHVTEAIAEHLAIIDTRQRLIGDHVTLLIHLADAAREGAGLCSATGLLEPMNAIGGATSSRRGARGRHAVATTSERSMNG
jgi:hypothetical protein